MNLACMVNRLEIAFWTTFVGVVQDRRLSGKVIQALMAILVALAFLLALAWARFPDQPAVSAAPIAVVPLPPRPSNGQSNLLVVQVDRLGARKSQVQSIWILGQAPQVPQIAVLPIFPAQVKGADGQLLAPFPRDINPDGAGGLPEALIDALKARGLWWDHYLLIDLPGLAQLVDALGGLQVAGQIRNGRQVAELITEIDADPHAAQALFLEVAQQFCSQSAALTRRSFGSAAGVLVQNSLSDLPPEIVENSLTSLYTQSGVACNFPIMNGR